MGIKRDALDAAFSDCIRAAANRCEAQGYPMYPNDKGGQNTTCSGQLECAHIFGRRAQSVRVDPLNAFSLCHTHHRFFTENPIEFKRFYTDQLGEEGVVVLRERWRNHKKWLKGEKAEARAHYREEFKRIATERAEGVTGPITVKGW